MNKLYVVKKKIFNYLLYIGLLIFILFNLSNSFKQYYAATLDGDVVESVLPYSGIQKTFDDPTGIKTIINKDNHHNPNRFFSHYFLHKTFRVVPPIFQKFVDPVESVYYTSACSKLVMQLIILLLLATIICGAINIFSLKFISTAAILIPFFQTNGWRLVCEIGIIDRSVSYCFFYTLPLIFLLLYNESKHE